jgi:hypothetical protein
MAVIRYSNRQLNAIGTPTLWYIYVISAVPVPRRKFMFCGIGFVYPMGSSAVAHSGRCECTASEYSAWFSVRGTAVVRKIRPVSLTLPACTETTSQRLCVS